MFSRLVKQLPEKEGVTEALKAENQMLWVQRINNIRSAAMEIVSNITCLFALDMILLVCVLKRLKRGDIFAERQQ